MISFNFKKSLALLFSAFTVSLCGIHSCMCASSGNGLSSIRLEKTDSPSCYSVSVYDDNCNAVESVYVQVLSGFEHNLDFSPIFRWDPRFNIISNAISRINEIEKLGEDMFLESERGESEFYKKIGDLMQVVLDSFNYIID